MPERRLLWPLLAYGALSVIAFARQGSPGRGRQEPRPRRVSGRPRATEVEPLGEAGCRRASGDTQGSEHRAQERGRGRHAAAPWRIPWRGWRDILWRTYEKINDNRLMAVAAGVAFFSLLALFPAISAFVSLYGLFADARSIDAQVSAMSGVLPGGAVDLLHQELTRLAANKSSLSAGFVVSFLF